MTIRKNFVFDESVATHLEELSDKEQKSMTAIVQEMIEERYKIIEKERKLSAARKVAGSMNGISADSTIQDIKANMNV